MTNVLSARHRLVGAALRRYRESRGYTLGDAARILEVDVSAVSRIETGQRAIRRRDLRDLLAEYDVATGVREVLGVLATPCREGWWTEFGHALPGEYTSFLEAESVATAVLCYAPVQLPELLRTADSERAVVAADPFVPVAAENAAAAAILARQRATLQGRGVSLTVLLGESALREQAGTPDEMAAQYRHLAEAANCPNITIRLLPLASGPTAAGGTGGFTILQFGPVPELGMVHVAGPAGGACPDDPDVAAAYLRVFTCVRAGALSIEESARRLRDLARARLAA